MEKLKLINIFLLLFNLLSFEKCFLFTVIVPIYNSERYLEESIISIIKQTIGFKNIQLILVNDGSLDNSEEICLKYENKFSKNIIYIKKKHKGVSNSRNIGMKYMIGKYINFLDSDDKWDYKAFKYFALFFKFYNIDYIAGRIKFFESKNKYHPLNYKFYKTRIIDLNQEYNCIQLHISSSIFKKIIVKERFFMENLSYSEDTLFINNILLIKPFFGVIREAKYYYRQRINLSSLMQKKDNNPNYYFDPINFVFNYFIKYSLLLYNHILPFIQFLMSYNLLYRIKSIARNILNSNNLKKYIILIEEILKKIEDKYILEQQILSSQYKIFLLSKKYKKDLRKELIFRNNSILYLNYNIINFNNESSIIIWRILKLVNQKLYLEGIDNFWFDKNYYFYYCKIGNKIIFPKYKENKKYHFYTLYGLIQKGRTIIFEIPFEISNISQIFYFYLSYLDNNIEIFPTFGRLTNIPNVNNSYYISGNAILKLCDKRIVIMRYNKQLQIEFEKQYSHELKQIGKKDIITIREKHFLYREKYKKDKKKNIWIISDGLCSARDNGEYLFRYLKSKKPKEIIPYYILFKNSSDYKRLKTFGGILDPNSKVYKFFYLEANKIISSFCNISIYNPYNKDLKFLRDLIYFDAIFIKSIGFEDDLSEYINILDKNFKLIIISSIKEYKTIINTKIGFNTNNIIITGVPKFDYIIKQKNNIKAEKKILIFPTWDKTFISSKNFLSNEYIYSTEFINAKFFEFYNTLINDKLLLFYMKKYNFTGIICLPPLIKNQSIDFKKNEFFFIGKNCDNINLLIKSSLLITDYSNLFFDFGYLRKPIIYTQIDHNKYKNNQIINQDFDYKKFGFGPICNNIRCTVKQIISELKNECKLKKKYERRIKRFFYYLDENNCKRVFEAIAKPKFKNIKNKNILVFIFLVSALIYILIKNIKFLL